MCIKDLLAVKRAEFASGRMLCSAEMSDIFILNAHVPNEDKKL